MSVCELLERLWSDYAVMNPQVGRIHQLLTDRGEIIVNDHIALRTFDDPRVNIDVLSRAFVADGYAVAGEYTFTEKKLNARHYEHDDASLPRVFISELKLAACSQTLRHHVATLLDRVDESVFERGDLPVIGRAWEISGSDYDALAKESEYAAWVAAFGFRANHFTVLVNALKTFDSLEMLNTFLKNEGFVLNSSGGEIKGSPEALLEQSSTLADQVAVYFTDGERTIPCCYYEFARRYPDKTGKLFSGFIAQNADKIFESTDRR